jgi:hypothetical protein
VKKATPTGIKKKPTQSASSKHTSKSPEIEIVRRSSRASRAPVNYDEEKLITVEYVPRVTRSKIAKNPLMGNKNEARSEFVKKLGNTLVDKGANKNNSDDENEIEIDNQLQKEKEKKIEIFDDAKLQDMKLLFGMPEEEIKAIKEKQEAELQAQREKELLLKKL